MLIKRENKNKKNSVGQLTQFMNIWYLQTVPGIWLVMHTLWKLNMSLFHIATTLDASEKVIGASDDQNSV